MKTFTTCSLLFLLCVLVVHVSAADLRSTTMELFVHLRKEGVATRFPDEMRSLDTAVAKAELYYQIGDTKNAEYQYRLAAEKGAMIRQLLNQPASPDLPPSPAPVSGQPDATKSTPIPAQQEPPLSQPPKAEPEPDIIASGKLTGRSGEYRVAKGETLSIVAAKLGVNRRHLANTNGLSTTSKLKEGQLLRYNNRHIIPEHRAKEGIIVNIPDRMLYYFQKGKLVFSTAVALGTPNKTELFDWQTPTGRFRIIAKAKDPTWTVPPSIQEEMRLEGKEIITSIPPGADNPLGRYAIKTTLPGILIHSTTKPWSIYTYASHGCIRVYPERMEELFKLIRVNTVGEIIYRPVKIATTETGRIFMEVNGDIYSKTSGIEQEARNLIRSLGLSGKVDWDKAKRVISQKPALPKRSPVSPLKPKKMKRRLLLTRRRNQPVPYLL